MERITLKNDLKMPQGNGHSEGNNNSSKKEEGSTGVAVPGKRGSSGNRKGKKINIKNGEFTNKLVTGIGRVPHIACQRREESVPN